MEQPSILVIDDDVIMQRLIMNVLVKKGYSVRACSSVAEGLSLIEQRRPDAVLCDLLLPVTNGVAFLRHCRASAELHDLPIIIIASTDTYPEMNEAMAEGANAYLVKPFSQAQLLQTVASLFEAGQKNEPT